jgi:di/tricarboxylate transporter
MAAEQLSIIIVLIVVLGLFIWGKWRYDFVALLALFFCMLMGIVPIDHAFSGFGHPATITVSIVLILSYGLTKSGAVEGIAHMVSPLHKVPSLHIAALIFISAILSMFMNNVGALALLMPVAIQSTVRAGLSPSAVLMPLSFASILGGMATLIGTPPNIIIATYRQDVMGESFHMFDFSPVGCVVAAVGVLFVGLVSRYLVPVRKSLAGTTLFEIEPYLFEIKILKDSELKDKTVKDLEEILDDYDIILASLMHRKQYYPIPPKRHKFITNDLLILKGKQEDIDKLVLKYKLALLGADNAKKAVLHSSDTVVMEAVLMPGARIESKAVGQVRFKANFGVNLLAISRQGKLKHSRLRDLQLKAGDVLLLHGEKDHVGEAITKLDCVPLAERGMDFGKRKFARPALLIFCSAIALSAFGVLPMVASLGGAVLLFVALNIIPMRELYDGVNWPVIVLLGAMIPIGEALESTGTTTLIATGLLNLAGDISMAVLLASILIITMTLSDILNNAATAILMAPVAKNIAELSEVSVDPFLMAVAIGASCAFLTPIGHQNNAMIMGPGGYHFGDYWRIGLPLEIIIVLTAVPLILIVWPLTS